MEVKFKKNLTTLRRAKNFSQEQLAEKLDVSRQSVGKWESGEAYPEMKMLLQICDFFAVSLEDLVHGDVSAPDHNLRKQYEKVFTHRARFVATGVASIVIGVAFLLGLLAIFGSDNEPVAIAGAAALMLFIAVGVMLFIMTGNAVERFEKSHEKLPTTLYKPEETETKISRHQAGLAVGVSLIIVGVAVLLTLLAIFGENNETVAVAGAATMMLFIDIGTSVITYNALQKGKYDIAKYNLEHSKEYLAKNRKIGMISGIIMMSATAIFLLFGFLCKAWNIAWIIFPICGIACGIISVALHHGDQN